MLHVRFPTDSSRSHHIWKTGNNWREYLPYQTHPYNLSPREWIGLYCTFNGSIYYVWYLHILLFYFAWHIHTWGSHQCPLFLLSSYQIHSSLICPSPSVSCQNSHLLAVHNKWQYKHQINMWPDQAELIKFQNWAKMYFRYGCKKDTQSIKDADTRCLLLYLVEKRPHVNTCNFW